jgi:hypothetical protein
MSEENTKTEVPEKPHEKGALQSKKFIAFLLCELGFFVLMALMLLKQEMELVGENMAFMTLAVTSGFLAVGYILGQAYIDKYIRVAQITTGNGGSNTNEGEK